jgi:hypothetical protein
MWGDEVSQFVLPWASDVEVVVGGVDVSEDEFTLGIRLAGKGRVEFDRTAFTRPMNTYLRQLALLLMGESHDCGESKNPS